LKNISSFPVVFKNFQNKKLRVSIPILWSHIPCTRWTKFVASVDSTRYMIEKVIKKKSWFYQRPMITKHIPYLEFFGWVIWQRLWL
jgi:hypothetical protein